MSTPRSLHSFSFLLIVASAIVLANHAAQAQDATGTHPLEVVHLLEGKMDTTAQAATNSNAPSVQMITCRVPAPPNTLQAANLSPAAILLYQEQALTRTPDRPYRQRWLAIAPHATGDVASIAFKPSQPEALIGLCDRPLHERHVPATDLTQPLCTVFLTPTRQGYRGTTPPQGCPAKVRNAVRITNEIELTPSGMNTWDRGFDASGKQVWGANTEAYQFRRR